MFRSGSRVLLVVLLVVSSILATSLMDTQEAKAVELPSFRFPWPSSLNGEVKWVGGMHQYSNLNDAATVPINSGSGIDFASSSNPNFLVLSMAPGTVLFAGWGAFGNQVAVKHDQGGSVAIYGHLDSIAPGAIEGLPISRGEPIGYAGNTTPNPPMNTHLHVELRDGAADCCLGDMGGNPVSWHGKSIDGWTFYEYRNNSESAATLMYNYDGVAVLSSVLPVETAGIFTTNAAMTTTEYLYTHLPSGYECYTGGACDIQSTSADVAFSNHGSFGGGAAFYSSNTVSDPEPDPTPIPGPTDTPVPQYGDSHVDIREDPNYVNGQYGWDNPTGGWFNVPDYMDNKASSIELDAGWSIMVAQDQNGGGLKKCLVRSEPNLSNAYYDGGSNMNDTISSVWVYQDTTCGGQYVGTEPGDTVTVWVDPNYWGTHYGWHDSNWSGNVPDYVQNQISSIGIQPGWSIVLRESQNQGGGFACLTGSDPDLTDNWFGNGNWLNDNIESVTLYADTNCGGETGAPDISLAYTVVDPINGIVEANATWSDAAEDWHVLAWGANDATVGYFGQSGTSVGHSNGNQFDYDPGTYTLTFTVKGANGQIYVETQVITIEPPPQPVFSFSAAVIDPIHGLVETEATWNNTAEDWHVIDWGDGTETGYFGPSGTNMGHENGNTHYYSPGTYTLTFLVKGLDSNVYTDTQTVTINPPSYSLTATAVDQNSGLVETNATWSNAENDWQVLNWGDGTETGYFGSSGTNVGHENGNTHVYAPGTYTLTFTVKGGNGAVYQTTQLVTIEAQPTPTPPPTTTPIPQPTFSLTILSADEQTNEAAVEALWSTAAEDWQVVDWGDGTSVGYFGASGTSVGHENGNTKVYNPGTYTITFNVKGLDGQTYTATQQVTFTD